MTVECTGTDGQVPGECDSATLPPKQRRRSPLNVAVSGTGADSHRSSTVLDYHRGDDGNGGKAHTFAPPLIIPTTLPNTIARKLVRTANVRLWRRGHLRCERGRRDVMLGGVGAEMCEWGKKMRIETEKEEEKSYIDCVVSCSSAGIES